MKPPTKSHAQESLNLITPRLRKQGVSDYVLRALAAQFGDLTVPPANAVVARKKKALTPFQIWARSRVQP